jgi:hypothetical protein
VKIADSKSFLEFALILKTSLEHRNTLTETYFLCVLLFGTYPLINENLWKS